MKNAQNPYTVRLNMPVTDDALRQFSLAVSDALTRLGNATKELGVIQGESVQGKTGSWSIALYDDATGVIAFLPGVRFIPVGADDVNVGFELDVSPRVGSEGISGTSQGYMANYGTVGGSKLAAGMSANNEDPNIPRLDLGFKPKRGATMEFYGSDGDIDNKRKGQLRATLGPTGQFVVVRYVSGDTWEALGGFGHNGELVCGYRNWGWPGNGPASTTAPTASLTVFNQGDTTTDASIVATISKTGVITGSKLTSGNSSNKVSIQAPTSGGEVTLTLQKKYFLDAGGTVEANPSWVLCAVAPV